VLGLLEIAETRAMGSRSRPGEGWRDADQGGLEAEMATTRCPRQRQCTPAHHALQEESQAMMSAIRALQAVRDAIPQALARRSVHGSGGHRANPAPKGRHGGCLAA